MRRASLASATAMAAVLLAACTASGNERDAVRPDLCAVLSRPGPEPQPADDPTMPAGTNGELMARLMSPSEVLVYLDPTVDDEGLAEVAEEIAARPEVASTLAKDRATSFAEFQELFADQPHIREDVDADDLPTRVIVRLVDFEETAAFVDWAEDQPTTYEVRSLDRRSIIGDQRALFVTEVQRAHWRRLADQLRASDEPWTDDAADVVDLLLTDATNGRETPGGEARLDRVARGLETAMEACGTGG